MRPINVSLGVKFNIVLYDQINFKLVYQTQHLKPWPDLASKLSFSIYINPAAPVKTQLLLNIKNKV